MRPSVLHWDKLKHPGKVFTVNKSFSYLIWKGSDSKRAYQINSTHNNEIEEKSGVDFENDSESFAKNSEEKYIYQHYNFRALGFYSNC